MNTQVLFCMKTNKQLVKLGKYFADLIFAFHDLPQNTVKIGRREKFPILRYVIIDFVRMCKFYVQILQQREHPSPLDTLVVN